MLENSAATLGRHWRSVTNLFLKISSHVRVVSLGQSLPLWIPQTQDQHRNVVPAKSGPQPIRAKVFNCNGWSRQFWLYFYGQNNDNYEYDLQDDGLEGSSDFFEGSGEDDEELGSAFYAIEWYHPMLLCCSNFHSLGCPVIVNCHHHHHHYHMTS